MCLGDYLVMGDMIWLVLWITGGAIILGCSHYSNSFTVLRIFPPAVSALGRGKVN